MNVLPSNLWTFLVFPSSLAPGHQWRDGAAIGNLFLIIHSLRSGQIALLLEILDDDLDGILDTGLVAVDMDLGLQGLLIGGTDAGELGDLALTGLLVQALGVALLGDLDGDVDPDLDEGDAGVAAGPLGLVHLAGQVAVRPVRADEASDGEGGRVGEQLGYLGDAPDVLLAVLGREPQVLVQPEPDIVAVQSIRCLVVRLAQQCLLQRHRDGRFAARGEPRQPDRQALLLPEPCPDLGRQGRRVVVDVAVLEGHVSMYLF